MKKIVIQKELIQYTDAFKAQVLNDLETGVCRSYTEAQMKYKIGGSQTIKRWIGKSGKTHLLFKKVVRDL
jgi:hypothetical protein